MPPKGFLKKDYTGLTFNKFKVLALARKGNNSLNMWLCRCDCGNEIEIQQSSIGRTFSCGCHDHRNDFRKAKVGIKTGKLTCLSFEYIKNKNAYYKYRCDCGNEIITQGNSVKTGGTSSCGCLYKETRPQKIKFLEDGTSLLDFIKDKGISTTHAFSLFKKQGEIGLKSVLNDRSNGSNQSALENFVSEKTKISFFNNKILKNHNYRPDFKLSESVYLNTDGLYWHREEEKGRHYHFKLREAFESENKRILQFYEDEIYNKWSIIESIVNNTINKTANKIYARKCKIDKVDNKAMIAFFDENHLMGGNSAAKAIGLYQDGVLVSCLSYRIYKNKYIEISRFGSVINTVVVGGFQKLLAMLEDIASHNDIKEIVSFCDLRYATGTSYEKAGFKRTSVTLGWCWGYGINRYNRLMCKASNGKTEAENAASKGWYKIYDAGQAKYVKTLT